MLLFLAMLACCGLVATCVWCRLRETPSLKYTHVEENVANVGGIELVAI